MVCIKLGSGDEAMIKSETARSVLVVEDEGLVALLLREVLTDLGLKPHVFNEGVPALATIGTTPYTAAILDLGLPDLDGDEIVKALLARDPAFPIVLTTGQDQQEVESRFPNASRVRVLAKPFDIGMLENELALLGIVGKPNPQPARRIEHARARECLTA
jgi:Response regulator containing CheY-like receiver, AAA-type ATPase, and DNA-binding domains